MERTAENGHVRAQAQLAFFIYYGRGIAANEEKGLKLLHRAAEGGDVWVQSQFDSLS